MKLFYKKYGETGTPIFIMHGVFGMLDNWHNIAGKLVEEGFVVYTVDARNHGHSPHSPEMGYDIMADDLAELMNDVGESKAIIIGHSMGGKTAMKFAFKYPDKVEKLVCVDIAPKRYKPGHLEILDAFKRMDLSVVTSRKEADEMMATFISDMGVRQFLLKNLHRNDDNTYSWKHNIAAIDEHYYEIIGELETDTPFNKPTLFIKGAKSAYIKPHDEEHIRTMFSNVQFVEVANAGHWVQAENPDGFLVALLNFIK